MREREGNRYIQTFQIRKLPSGCQVDALTSRATEPTAEKWKGTEVPQVTVGFTSFLLSHTCLVTLRRRFLHRSCMHAEYSQPVAALCANSTTSANIQSLECVREICTAMVDIQLAHIVCTEAIHCIEHLASYPGSSPCQGRSLGRKLLSTICMCFVCCW